MLQKKRCKFKTFLILDGFQVHHRAQGGGGEGCGTSSLGFLPWRGAGGVGQQVCCNPFTLFHIRTLIIFYWNTEMLENLVLFYKGWWLSSGLLWQSSSSTSLLLRFLHLCYNMILILNCISWTFQWWSDLNENLLPCQAMQWKKNFLNCFHSRLSLWSTPACWREILAISNWSKSANI